MKKFKNLVIGGIETKVFNLILISILLVTVAGLLITNYQNGVLADLTAETSTRQREAIGTIIPLFNSLGVINTPLSSVSYSHTVLALG